MSVRTVGRVPRRFIAMAILFLVLVMLPPVAYVQGPAPAGAVNPLPVTTDNVAATSAVTTGPDCNKPPSGKKVRLISQNQIVVAACRSQQGHGMDLSWIRDADKRLSWGGPTHYYGDFLDIRWPSITTADLNGDYKYEEIIAGRDQNQRIAVMSFVGGLHFWYSDLADCQGPNVAWVDIAAGNLDGHLTQDHDDEVVVAFSDSNWNLHLFVLDQSNLSQPNTSLGSYKGSFGVHYVAVATGDLDGDGYDNEIVATLIDDAGYLRCLIFRLDAKGQPLKLLWQRRWENHDRFPLTDPNRYEKWGYTPWQSIRPVDVTTGDVDGDFQDEAILAFRDANWGNGGGLAGGVQLLSLDYQGLDPQLRPAFDDRVFIQYDPSPDIHDDHVNVFWVPCVSVSAADLDGNGRAEIALAYTVEVERGAFAYTRYFHGYHFLRTYEYVLPGTAGWSTACQDDKGRPVACWHERSHWQGGQVSWMKSSEDSDARCRLVLDAGDLDGDGKAEIALVRRDDQSGSLQVIAFDGSAALTEIGRAEEPGGYGPAQELWLALGDLDGKSVYADYTGGCYATQEAHVTALIHAPPHWSEGNEEHTLAGFGESIGGGTGKGETTETKVGGSVKIGFELKGIGESFTYGWQKSCAVEQTEIATTIQGVKFETNPHPSNNPPHWGAVGYNVVPYWCYTYTEHLTGKTATVCLPRPSWESRTLAKPLEWWYTTGISEFPTSWVPVGMNLARGGTAIQSSTAANTPPNGPAGRAVDGNTDGDPARGSLSVTNVDQNAWWQVDLGIMPTIHAIQVWNRTDLRAEHLKDFYVFVSDVPFASTNLNATLNQPGVWHYHVPGQGGRPTTVVVNRLGRYVRVQLAGQDALSLAEVQVWGVPAEVDQWSKSMPIAGTNTFTITLPNGSRRVVDGQLLWQWQGAQIAVEPGSIPVEFDIGGGNEKEYIEEGSTEKEVAFGFEVKWIEGEQKWGRADKTSRITKWSKETEFSGEAGGLPSGAAQELQYTYEPYVWLQKATSSEGVEQAFLVLDYWVPHTGPYAAVAGAAMPAVTLGLTPTAPLLGSPTHPDPATWYFTSTATFTWTQPAGDPAVVAGYRWYLDGVSDTIPSEINMGLTTTHTDRNLRDGLWYLHVRAMGDGGEWGQAAHRAIRVDVLAPHVDLTLAPAWPTGNTDWYVSPVTVTVATTDGLGSGVAAVEVSTDKLTWQPYAAPWQFLTDTMSTTVWARATDIVGHTSVPVSATFKIDGTPPSSETPASPMPGAWIANVVTDTLGNEHLVLAGVITDALSGRADMNLQANGGAWTSASAIGVWHPFPGQPTVEVNWYYTATTELGRGNHIFAGRSHDRAGNAEAAYEIAQVVWFPQSAPDLRGSSLTVTPGAARPGDMITFTLVARNAGWQEAQVAVIDTLPAGLTLVTDTLASDVGYDPATGIITWPARLVWPGEWTRFDFHARVDAVGATTLENRATVHACWPNSEALPATQRQRFRDLEQTVVVTATVTVNPYLPVGADVTAPWVGLHILSKQVVTGTEAALSIPADASARWMYLREWTLDPATGVWIVAQDSGWLRYSPTYTWTLSAGDGVKYLGVWVADRAGNVSVLDERGLAFTNLIGASHSLADGQRAQYRFDLQRGLFAGVYVEVLAGDPDLYIWKPRLAFWPNYYSNANEGPGTVEEAGGWVDEVGIYLVEIKALGNSQYQLTPFLGSGLMPGEAGSLPRAKTSPDKDRPPHPLAVSDPLSAGREGTPTGLPPFEIFLPLVFKGG